MNIKLGIRYDWAKNATEQCGLDELFKTYEADILLALKKYLALYGVAQESVCTDLCERGVGGIGWRSYTRLP